MIYDLSEVSIWRLETEQDRKVRDREQGLRQCQRPVKIWFISKYSLKEAGNCRPTLTPLQPLARFPLKSFTQEVKVPITQKYFFH